MKNFCPNCGTPLKPGAEFCPNCGTKIKKKLNVTQQAPAPMSPKKPKKNNNVKIIVGALVAIVTICAVIFVVIYHNESSNMQNETKSAMTHKSKKKVKKNTDQSAPSNSSQNSSDSENYSNDEWMLMGYMAYAYDNYVESDNISNNSELVDAVQDDLSNGDLEVKKNSDTTYTLTNKYGSVDVTVISDNVEVSNDGDTTTAKSELKKKFSSYKDQIQKMTSYIKNSNSNFDEEDKSKNNKQSSEKTDHKDITLPPVVVPVAMRGTWYSAGLLEGSLGDKVRLETNSIDGKKLYYLDKAPNNNKLFEKINEEYQDDLVVTGKQPSNSISYTPGGGQTDASGFSLVSLDNTPCLIGGSQGSKTLYFKTPELAQKFTNKYKNDKKLNEKLMDLQK